MILYYNTNMKIINDIISKPAPWMYVLLVLCLLVIISTNSTEKKNLQAEIDSIGAEYDALETSTTTTLEAMAGEIAVRDDAVAGMGNEIAGLSNELSKRDSWIKDLEAKLSEGEATSSEAITSLKQELGDTKTLLDVCTASQTQ